MGGVGDARGGGGEGAHGEGQEGRTGTEHVRLRSGGVRDPGPAEVRAPELWWEV